MVSSRVVMAGLAVAGLVGVAGCGGSSSEKAGSSVPVITASSKASSPTTSASASPSSSGTASALQHTEAGGLAFVHSYVATMSSLGRSPRTGVLEAMSLPECGPCSKWAAVIASLKRDGEHYGSDSLRLRTSDETAVKAGADVHVLTTLEQLSTKIISSDGKSRSGTKPSTLDLAFILKWTNGGWKVANFQKRIA